MHTPFTLTANDLMNLGPQKSVELTRRLLWAEASRTGLARHLINAPDCINVGDGGLDAHIQDSRHLPSDVIPEGASGFQVKSSDLGPEACKKELHIGKDLAKPLKPEIKNILDAHGTYVLVLFAEPTAPAVINREGALRDELGRLGYSNPVRVYTASKLAGFAEAYPALASWLKNGIGPCQPFDSWGKQPDIASPKDYEPDAARCALVDTIRNALLNPGDQGPVFRVDGLPGIGKTRLVYEALKLEGLRQRVVYTDAERLVSSQLLDELQRNDDLSAIVVADECDADLHDKLVRSLASRGDRLSLITISCDMRSLPLPTTCIRVDRLSTTNVDKIIRHCAPSLPEEVVLRVAEFADGFPRVAVLLADSYLAAPPDVTVLAVNDDVLMDRLIAEKGQGSDHFIKTKRVLSALSPFTKVGYRDAVRREADWLAESLGMGAEFREIVDQQQKRGVVQGTSYVSVSPFMLKVHLLREWWNVQSFTAQTFATFAASIPEGFRADLLDRFAESLPYLGASEEGIRFVREVMAQGGPFCDYDVLNSKLGSKMFWKLAEAVPEAGLQCLTRALGSCSKEQLLGIREGRRNLVWALEMIAMWRELFREAARLLLALGEAENETCSNNASGVFAELFSAGWGRVAPTEASPAERFPVLEEALHSDALERQRLGLRGCEAALQTGHFTRLAGAEHQGLRKLPEQWHPKDWPEVIDAYKRVWTLVRSSLDDLSPETQQMAVETLLNRAYGLRRVPDLTAEVIETLAELADKPYVDSRKVLERVIWQLRHDSERMTVEERRLWTDLHDHLVGNDTHSLMRRYVGMSVLEEEIDEHRGRSGRVQEEIEALAEAAVSDPSMWVSELAWLTGPDVPNGYRFGHAVGTRDLDCTLLPAVLEAQRQSGDQGSAFTLGGYLCAVFQRDVERWESVLDGIADDEALRVLVPELTWRSGMTRRAGLRILKLAESGAVEPAHLRVFGFGKAISDVDSEVLNAWLNFLMSGADPTGVVIALDLCSTYYLHFRSDERLPKGMGRRLLLHEVFFGKAKPARLHNMVEYHWAQLAKAYLKECPDQMPRFLARLLESMGNDNSIISSGFSQAVEVIDFIAETDPVATWGQVARLLGKKNPPHYGFYIELWLRGEDRDNPYILLDYLPLEIVWEWIDASPEKRALRAARFVPKGVTPASQPPSPARQLLVRYGGRQDVRSELRAASVGGVWVGRLTDHFLGVRNWLQELRSEETDDNVRQWIDEYLDLVNVEIQAARLYEEREDR